METFRIKSIVSKITFSIIFSVFVSSITSFKSSAKSNDADSTVINIDKRNQTLLNSKNPSRSLKEDLQELFQKNGMNLDDDTWKGIRRVVNSELSKDTVLVITQNNKSINVAINAKTEELNRSSATNQSTRREYNINNNSNVKIGGGGVHVKDGRDEVHVSWNGVVVKDGNDEVKVILKDTAKVNRRDQGFSSRSGFNIYFGFNGFSNTGSISGIYNSKDFELSPFGSRYFGFGWTRSGMISKGAKAALKISYGLEVSWNNFMFENNNYLVKGTNNVAFENYKDSKGDVIPLSRNKLTVANINIPVMPYVAFKKGSVVTYVAAGGYVGYRIDSYTKTKEEDSGDKNWNHSSFYLNNLRYGLAFELGLKNFPDLFVNYDMNKLFQDGRGPGISGVSFGIRL
ncbi:outer membrane beta-barrel protein [Arcicella lustrica]|uniref:Outer membrane protein beta-barrel domain-containing protein n=1 Tax=Arcicella lustrica TaxID=2984196 RepID=A0ABU5SGJ1_9BACT|nr:hypothetical protein [Arcicella sp. DC25W]MEA5426421.1 hypothetical protein [Arcicella sp. DC25W]